MWKAGKADFDFWQKKLLLLAFARKFGCTRCKEMLEELVSRKDKIEQAGLEIAVIQRDQLRLHGNVHRNLHLVWAAGKILIVKRKVTQDLRMYVFVERVL